jgi:serine/threonine-protein kinase
MYVLAASFAAMVLLIPYLTVWGPADFDVQATFDNGAMLIRVVEATSAAAEAGLASGDRVVAIDDWPMRNTRDWIIVQANQHPVVPQRWQIQRGGDRVELRIAPTRNTLATQLTHGYLGYEGTAITCFILGLLIAFRRPNDTVARLGAWFIMTASIAFGLPHNWAFVWRQLPALVQLLLWVPQVSRFVIDGIFLSLFLVFPRHLVRSRWPWVALWTPVLVTLPWRLFGFNAIIHPTTNGSVVPFWVNQAIFIRTMAYLAVGIVLLVVGYRHLTDINERRRVRVLVSGTAVAFVGAIFLVWYFNFVGKGLAVAYIWPEQIAFGLLLACPLSFYYAIVRHRAFDIQIIVRQSLQYALARKAILGVVPVVAAALLLDLTLNRELPLIEVMRARGWIYAALAGLVILAYRYRKAWLDAVDRRFFREQYDAQRVLRETVKEIGQANDFSHAAVGVAARVEAALHSEFVSVLVRDPNALEFRSVACAPSSQIPPVLPAASKLVGLARLLDKPLEGLLSDSSWLDDRLPDEEIRLVHQARIDFLVPIAVDPATAEALIVLGVKRSEEPYTREDQELLEAIASSLTLLLTRPVRRAERDEAFRECPDCGACYDAAADLHITCAHEGSLLISIRRPRTLCRRYRLDRRLGRGGMGTVYEALDIALARVVAVKILRDDLVNPVDMAHRFRREAQVAAAFSHPNVVTVYDYGLESGAQGFIVMELLRGSSLRDEIARSKRLSLQRTAWILRGICAAVEAAHRKHLIHRDLKPENIFLAHAGEDKAEIVKVLDFGIAKFLALSDCDAPTRVTTETGAGVLIGTPAYLSPEQLLGEDPSVRWDLWALAVVAYESLAGIVPFSVSSTRDWRRNILYGTFVPIRDHVEDAPPAWQSFFEECFSPDLAKRPASVRDFWAKFEAISAAHP